MNDMTDIAADMTLDRRFSPAGNANYDLKKLWPLHDEIARQMLIGVRPVQIARNLEITTQTVSNVTNNPIFKLKFSGMRVDRDASSVDISKRIKDVGMRAIDLLEKSIEDDMVKGEVTQVGVRAAITVIDHSIPKKVEGMHIHGHLTTNDITKIKQDAIKAGAVIADDADFEDVSKNAEHSDSSQASLAEVDNDNEENVK